MAVVALLGLMSFWLAWQGSTPSTPPSSSSPRDFLLQERPPSPLILGADIALEEIQRVPLLAPSAADEPSESRADDLDVLAHFASTAIAPDGRVLVQDRENGAVHVFDPGDGRRHFVCSPGVMRRSKTPRILAAEAGGRILVQWGPFESGFDVYGPGGASRGTWAPTVEDPPGFVPGDFAPLSDSEGYWVLRTDRVLARIHGGREVIELDARPDGWGWRSVTLDALVGGGLAVIDHPDAPPYCALAGMGWKPSSDPSPRSFLFVFDGSGRVLRQLLLPAGMPCGRLLAGVGWLAFAGGRHGLRLVDLRSDRVCAVRVPADVSDRAIWGFPAQRTVDELWCVDPDARCLVRFELPASLAK